SDNNQRALDQRQSVACFAKLRVTGLRWMVSMEASTAVGVSTPDNVGEQLHSAITGKRQLVEISRLWVMLYAFALGSIIGHDFARLWWPRIIPHRREAAKTRGQLFSRRPL